MNGIKIRIVEIDGEKRVPPECFRLLMEFAAHKSVCEQCESAYKAGEVTQCATGFGLLKELGEQPEVEPNVAGEPLRDGNRH